MATSAGSGSHWSLTNKDYDADLPGGQDFTLRFAIYYSATAPDLVNIKFNGESLCDDEKQAGEGESPARSGPVSPMFGYFRQLSPASVVIYVSYSFHLFPLSCNHK